MFISLFINPWVGYYESRAAKKKQGRKKGEKGRPQKKKVKGAPRAEFFF